MDSGKCKHFFAFFPGFFRFFRTLTEKGGACEQILSDVRMAGTAFLEGSRLSGETDSPLRQRLISLGREGVGDSPERETHMSRKAARAGNSPEAESAFASDKRETSKKIPGPGEGPGRKYEIELNSIICT